MRCYNKYSSSILLSLQLIILILDSQVLTTSSSCQTESCGNIKIPYPFGIEKGCYLEEWYKIECRNAILPFLAKIGMEVVNISLPGDGDRFYNPTSVGSIRVRSQITSVGCSGDGKETGSVLNLKDSPFFLGTGNSLVAVGFNSKVSLTNMEPIMVGCELNCTSSANASKETFPSESIPFFDKTGRSTNALPYTYTPVCTENKGGEERSCDGNGCCRASLPDDVEAQQVIGVRIDGNSTNRECRVAFLTDEVYTLSNVTKPQSFFAKGYATVRLGWVTQTKNLSFIKSLNCKNSKEYENLTYIINEDTYLYQDSTSCVCNNITISGTNYANCGCGSGYRGNPYRFDGCKGQYTVVFFFFFV